MSFHPRNNNSNNKQQHPQCYLTAPGSFSTIERNRMTVSFEIPFVASTTDSWGPPAIDEANPNAPGNVTKFAALPYAPFGRSDRLGRAADFTNSRGNYGGATGDRFSRATNRNRRHVEQETPKEADVPEESFQLVDTAKVQTTKRFMNPANKRRQQSQRLRQINARRQQSAGGAAGPQMVQMGRGTCTTHAITGRCLVSSPKFSHSPCILLLVVSQEVAVVAVEVAAAVVVVEVRACPSIPGIATVILLTIPSCYDPNLLLTLHQYTRRTLWWPIQQLLQQPRRPTALRGGPRRLDAGG